MYPVNQSIACLFYSVDNITIPSKTNRGVLKRVPEVFDCWFESGRYKESYCDSLICLLTNSTLVVYNDISGPHHLITKTLTKTYCIQIQIQIQIQIVAPSSVKYLVESSA